MEEYIRQDHVKNRTLGITSPCARRCTIFTSFQVLLFGLTGRKIKTSHLPLSTEISTQFLKFLTPFTHSWEKSCKYNFCRYLFFFSFVFTPCNFDQVDQEHVSCQRTHMLQLEFFFLCIMFETVNVLGYVNHTNCSCPAATAEEGFGESSGNHHRQNCYIFFPSKILNFR